MKNKEQTLKEISRHLDISPSDFKIAQQRFDAVKNWLNGGDYDSGYSPDIYLQGSFRLGTVIKPYREDRDGDFDIDLVCELSVPYEGRAAQTLKNDVGDRLKENDDYERMLDQEGARCWTLEYASEQGRPGFHLDILPALPTTNTTQLYQIDITHKDNKSYSWSTSNPKGYYQWFKSKNVFTEEFVEEQRQELFGVNREIYNSLNDVPKQLFRSNLQRAIQIMKRHRDIHFAKKENKPISIIITTITTQVKTLNSIDEILGQFIAYVLGRYETLINSGNLNWDGVLDYDGNKWVIPNPLNDVVNIENFADKWEENLDLPLAFFSWVMQLKRDLDFFRISGVSDDLNLSIKKFGDGESYLSDLKRDLQQKSTNDDQLLNLIHLGIEKKVDWELIKDLSLAIFNNQNSEHSKEVAKINYYQIAKHRGLALSEEAIKDIKDILLKHQNDSAFVMCCNLLLGTETSEMVRRCLSHPNYINVIEWPILKLAKPSSLQPK